mgnify:CR=1 FL=1
MRKHKLTPGKAFAQFQNTVQGSTPSNPNYTRLLLNPHILLGHETKPRI